METKTRSRVSHQSYDDESNYSGQSSGNDYTNGSFSAQARSESSEEVQTEVVGSGDPTGGSETDETVTNTSTTLTDPHKSVSSPYRPAQKKAEASDVSAEFTSESTDTESSYESVEGWQESQPTESDPEAEPVIEASFADLESSEDGKEFFGAIAALVGPILLPMAKSLLPSLAGAAVKGGTKLAKGVFKKIKPRLPSGLLQQLKQANIDPKILKMLETGEEFNGDGGESGDESVETDEAAIEAFRQQIEALEVVIGQDDRVQIANTTVIPWKRICHLKIQAANGKNYLGTGFFIGPRTILTAGHCVYIHGQGGWAKQIVVTPGRNDTNEPFGKFTSTTFRSVQGWVTGKQRNYDYGVIQLSKTNVVSPSIGAFGFGNYSDQFILGKRLNTAGYPGDKPSGTIWFNGRKAKSVTTRTITYDIDTAGGQSGSPVWFLGPDGQRIVVGIHTNGATSGNSATRIVKQVFDNLKKWRAEGGNQL